MSQCYPNVRLIPQMTATLMMLLCCACGSKVKLHPASGQVFVAGKPAEGAIVVLHSLDPSTATAFKPAGKVDADGIFTLSTRRQGDGAPAGEYIVTIVWLGDLSTIDPATGEVPVRLSPHYGDPKTSPLRASIERGKNEIPAFYLEK